MFDIFTHSDLRGKLGVIEGDHIPFDIRRIYYLYDVPENNIRGVHAHKELQQVMIAMHGSVEVRLNDGTTDYNFKLDSPSRGLYVPRLYWRELSQFSFDCFIFVLASQKYIRDDYIFEYDAFIEYLNS